MKSIGIFGGAFDPVHFGHLRAAVEIVERFELSILKLVPCSVPPLKEATGASGRHRKNMLQLAIEGQPQMFVDDVELNRDGPSYTIDTVSEIKNTHDDASLVFFMGSDAFCSLNRWHKWKQLLDMVNIVVMHRPGWQLDTLTNEKLDMEIQAAIDGRLTNNIESLNNIASGRILLMPLREIFISSSEIRSLIKNNKSARYLLPDKVLDYINTEKLYT